MDDGRRRERGRDLETRGIVAHTSGPSACHPLDRSATLLLMHGAREDLAISDAALALLQLYLPEAESLCVCCSCAALCTVWWMASAVHGCACSTHALLAVSSAEDQCSR
jgi:hypothetical protein